MPLFELAFLFHHGTRGRHKCSSEHPSSIILEPDLKLVSYCTSCLQFSSSLVFAYAAFWEKRNRHLQQTWPTKYTRTTHNKYKNKSSVSRSFNAQYVLISDINHHADNDKNERSPLIIIAQNTYTNINGEVNMIWMKYKQEENVVKCFKNMSMFDVFNWCRSLKGLTCVKLRKTIWKLSHNLEHRWQAHIFSY